MKFLVKFFSVCFWTLPSLHILIMSFVSLSMKSNSTCFWLWNSLNWTKLNWITVSILYVVNFTYADVALSIYYFASISIFPYFFLGFWVRWEVNTCAQLIHYPNCIQVSPMKTFIQQMDSSSVANPSWYKNLSVRLRKPESRQIEGFALIDAVNWDRINMKI